MYLDILVFLFSCFSSPRFLFPFPFPFPSLSLSLSPSPRRFQSCISSFRSFVRSSESLVFSFCEREKRWQSVTVTSFFFFLKNRWVGFLFIGVFLRFFLGFLFFFFSSSSFVFSFSFFFENLPGGVVWCGVVCFAVFGFFFFFCFSPFFFLSFPLFFFSLIF